MCSLHDILLGPFPARCWPETFHAIFTHRQAYNNEKTGLNGGEVEFHFVPPQLPTTTNTLHNPSLYSNCQRARDGPRMIFFYRNTKSKEEYHQKLSQLSFMFSHFLAGNLFLLPAACRALKVVNIAHGKYISGWLIVINSNILSITHLV